MLMRQFFILFVILFFFSFFISLFYGMALPGVNMMTYHQGDNILLFVNSYTSPETLLPIDYYKLPMCQPNKLEYQSENLGEYLTGNRIENSPFQLEFLQPKICEILCIKNYKTDEIKKFDSMIKDNYNIHWIIDNLPVAMEDEMGNHELGFPLGTYYEDSHKVSELHNHFRIHIGYNVPSNSPNTTGRIVDFVVFPYSADYAHSTAYKNGKIEYCEPHEGNGNIKPLYLSTSNQPTLEVVWTYSVEWEEMPDREWRTRWDVYFELGNGNNEIHWFSILNALLVVLFLSGMVGMILLRNLHRDITRYNRVPTEEERYEEKEETGWKLIHSDVFRAPTKYPMLFCILIGTGYQILGMAFSTLLFACFGLLSPSHRGNLIIACLICFILSGFVAGYFSAQNYKLFKGKNWQSCTVLTSLSFPGFVFSVFFLLNLFVWGAGSNAAVPFGSMIVVVVLWFGISVPLVFLGSYYGYKRPTLQYPVATSNIPRPVPPQPWYMSHTATCLIGGILPFGAIFVELFFILTSLWTNKYYYVFGFLLLAVSILLGTCAEITIVLCYFQLCAEDYHWWWRSFFVSGACGFYVFLYSTYYFITRLDVSNVIGAMLYFGYMLIISIAIFIMTGMIGHKACLWFTTKIYASIKVD